MLQIVIELLFAAVAVRTVASLGETPDRRHRLLALAVVSLALLIMILPIYAGEGPFGRLTADLEIALFLLSGYGLIMFRDSFVPFSAGVRRLVVAAVGLAAAAALAVELVFGLGATPPAQQVVVLAFAIGVWAVCLIEPILTFWRASGGRPSVERARLRTLSAGYGGLLAVVVLGSLPLSQVASLLVDVLALAIVPALYVAFFPPAWVRRIWRQPEEEQLRLALHDLLLYSPNRATLAQRALSWAERLVGGDAGLVVDGDGAILAALGMTHDDASRIATALDFAKQNGQGGQRAPWHDGSTLVVPLDLSQGRGAMVIVSHRHVPLFGDDEMGRLRLYGTSITAGLDRVALNERIASLEKAKSDFLSIASHELRGPMTVIKGYLTMLESGALGEVSGSARSVLPLLIAKSDEVDWMIEGMTEASRLEEGRLALKRHRADIVELTDSAIESVRFMLTGHEVRFEQHAAPVETLVDPDRFLMVVRNLLSNAAKYSTAGSEIEVRVGKRPESAYVTVVDHGVGIALEDQAALFNRFSRVRNTEHVQGTGLGLWLSREIARMHDGDLTMKSEPGRGSEFTLTLPLTQ